MSALRALWWLLCPAPQPPGVRLGQGDGLKWLVLALVVLMMLSVPLFLLSSLDRSVQAMGSMDDVKITQVLGTADTVRIMELQSQLRYRDLSAETDPELSLPVLLRNAPDALREITTKVLVARGGRLAQNDCKDCVVLTWHEGRGWHADVRSVNPDFDGSDAIIATANAVKRVAGG